jgi:hypothetical protein
MFFLQASADTFSDHQSIESQQFRLSSSSRTSTTSCWLWHGTSAEYIYKRREAWRSRADGIFGATLASATTRAVIAEIRRAGKSTLAAIAQELEARAAYGPRQAGTTEHPPKSRGCWSAKAPILRSPYPPASPALCCFRGDLRPVSA